MDNGLNHPSVRYDLDMTSLIVGSFLAVTKLLLQTAMEWHNGFKPSVEYQTKQQTVGTVFVQWCEISATDKPTVLITTQN